MIHVFARARSRPEHGEEVRRLLQQLRRASRRESGVTQYDVFETEQVGEFLFFETYVDAAAFDAHKASRHIRVFASRVMPLLAEEFQVWVTRAMPNDGTDE